MTAPTPDRGAAPDLPSPEQCDEAELQAFVANALTQFLGNRGSGLMRGVLELMEDDDVTALPGEIEDYKEVLAHEEGVNRLVVGDTEQDLTDAYIAGAMACRRGARFDGHGAPDGSQEASDFEEGHQNEAAELHVIDGRDVVSAFRAGRTFVAPEIDDPYP